MADDIAVKRVTLDRLAASFTNQANEFRAPHPLRRGCPGVVVDLFFDDRTIDIVSAEALGNLRDLGGHHLPIGFDMSKVIQQ